MTTIHIILWSRPNTDNTHTVKLRFTTNRKSRYKSLNIHINKHHWNDLKKEIRTSHPNHVTLNWHIQKAFLEAKLSVLESQNTSHISLETNAPTSSFFDFADMLTQQLFVAKKYSSYKRNKALIGKLRKYRKGSDLLFSDITTTFLHAYDTYLKTTLGNRINTRHNNLKLIRSIFRKAIAEGLVSQHDNPFFSFKLKREKVAKTKLSEAHMIAISSLDLKPYSSLWNSRNYFCFQYFACGMRIGDLIRLQYKHIDQNRITYTMQKTKQLMSLKIVPQAQAILNHYWNPNALPDNYVFPILDPKFNYSDEMFLSTKVSGKVAIINADLKIIAAKVGINQRISTHTARHTFANVSRIKGVSIYDISKALNHSSIATTEGYLASMDQDSLDASLDIVFS